MRMETPGAANCTFPEALTGLDAHQIELNRNWTFQINGQRIFAHGANWLPCDMRISECTAEDYEYLMRSAALANMNFLRVWGGGGVEKQAFYDAADRYGIMIYQETVHSQSMPTRDVNFDNEKGEVAQMITKLSSHPSVVRYGWGNEFYG
jgi:beta-mannosidase